MLNHKDDDDDQPAAAAYSIEPVHSDQADGRSYECTYCKHGFTNAQALGGHMNVHRKERAKNRFNHQYSSTNYNYNKSSADPCLITSKLQGDQMKTREFMMLRSSPMMYDHHSNLLSEYQNPNYYGSIAAGTSDQEEMRLSLNLSLNLEFIGRSHEEESVDREGNEDVELDLELRLGQDP